MGVTSAIVRILLEAQDNASAPLAKAADKTESAWSGVGKKIAALGIGAAVAGFAKSAVSAASDLEQAMGATDAVFGDSAKTVHEWAQDTSDSIRLPASAFETLASSLGATWKRAGVPMDQLADKTKDTMGLAADMAARWGTSTEEAVGAISAALARGEFDPIEKYNVSLSAAAVETEKARLATEEMAGATDAALTTQARFNLIMNQSQDAIGAAAGESKTFAAQQEAFNEVWQNLLAAVGAPLLGALSSLLGMFTNVASAIAPALVALSEFVGWLLELPGPIQAAILLGAGWAIFGKQIVTGVSDMAAAFRKGITEAGGFKGAIGNVGKALAGGAVLGFAAYAIGSIVDAFGNSARAAAEAEQGAQDYANAILDAGGASTTAARQFRQTQIETSEGFQALIANGADYGEAMSFMTGGMTDASQASQGLKDALSSLGPDQTMSIARTQAQAAEAIKLADSKAQYEAAETAAGAATEATTALTEDQVKALADQAEAQRKAALEAAQAAAETTGVALALERVDSEAAAASRALDFFTISMDAIAGRNVTVEQATKALNDSMRGLGEQFTETATAGELNADALTSWNVDALTASEGGSALYDELNNARSAYDQATVAAYENAVNNGNAADAFGEAQFAAHNARNAFIDTAAAFVGGKEQAAALADQLGILDGTRLNPKTFELIAHDADAQAKVAALQAAGIDPKDIIITATADEATGEVANVVSVAEGANPNVDVGAITGDATKAIGSVENGKYDATVKVGADTMEAARSIAAMSSGRYTASISVGADTGNAANAVNGFTSAYRTTTISVFANTQPAENSIYRITSGYYTATIQVSANTAAASAQIAAARPKAVAAPAPAFSAAHALGAPVTPAPYPALHRMPTAEAEGAGGNTYQITIQGVLNTEAAAREIDQIMRSHRRRSAGVFL